MHLSELITAFESALAEKDWPQIALLDDSMQEIVLSARVAAEQSQRVAEFESELKALQRLYNQARDLVEDDREAVGIKIKNLAASKSGAAQYQANSTF